MNKIPQAKNWSIDKIVTDPENPNEMTKEQLEALKNNIKEWGFLIPIIVDRNAKIADGHQRLQAAAVLGMEEVPVIQLDIGENDRMIIQQVLNKLKGQHKEELDAKIFRKLWDAQAMGKLSDMLAVDEKRLVAAMEKHGSDSPVDVDDVPLSGALYVKSGDLYRLGDHFIFCGDSTKETTWSIMERAIEQFKADMVFTDPPYGVSYGENTEWGVMANDALRGEELHKFLHPAFLYAHVHTKDKAAMYCCYASINHIIFEQALNLAGWKVKQQIIWDKGMVMGRSDYHWAHEPILYGCKKDSNCEWWGDRTQKTIMLSKEVPELESLTKEELVSLLKTIHQDSNVWQVRKDNVQEYVHATQKPVELIKRAIKNSTAPGMVVLDCFGGSGSTLIACEVTGRKARLIEIEPRHVQTIINRWERLTGKTAEKIISI